MSLHQVPSLEQDKLPPAQEKEVNRNNVGKRVSHTKLKDKKNKLLALILMSAIFQTPQFVASVRFMTIPLRHPKYFADTSVAKQCSAQNPSDAANLSKTNYLFELQIYNKVYL